jgi:predicted PurR-regulated permease PerM
VQARSPFTARILVTILVLLLIAALRLGSSLLIPIALSILLALLLNPMVRGMTRWKIPESVGAAIVVFGVTGIIAFGAWQLADPASEWLKKAPEQLQSMESRLRRIKKPIADIQKTAERVEQAATTTGSGTASAPSPPAPSMVARLGYSTASGVGAALTVIFLTYFLIASGPLLKKKLPRLVPEASRRERMEHALTEIERHMSQYLYLNSVISLVVGLLTWGLLALLGFPNAILWATAAFIFNYVPYAGAAATLALIAFAGIVSFDAVDKTLLALGGFFLINLLEGNLITPTILGKTMPLNSLAIFTSLLFWGWVWGVAGAVLAVPLTVMVQVVCAHVPRLKPMAVLLDS